MALIIIVIIALILLSRQRTGGMVANGNWYIPECLSEAEKRIYRIVYRVSDELNVPLGLVMATIRQESNFDAGAFGADNEYGLMQIMLPTAQDMGFTGSPSELFEPEVNIYYGTKYLRYQFDRYDNWRLAVSAYNAGHATDRNVSYTNSVLNYWRQYNNCLGRTDYYV